jgi:hypothetical protein
MATMSFYMESTIVEICMHFCYMQFSTIYSTAPIKTYLLHFSNCFVMLFLLEGNELLFAQYFDYWQSMCMVTNSPMNS